MQITNTLVSVKGSDTYNKDKSKKSNKSKTEFLISTGQEAIEHTQNVHLVQSQQEEAEPLDSSQSETSESLPINKDMVRSCVVQFFDNGEDIRQRYRFKIRLNLTDGKNPEFISSLTKRWSDFVKYIPSICRQEIIDLVSAEREIIKNQTGHFPYIGKFHLNQGSTRGRHNHQTEPYTFVILWYDNTEREWQAIIKIYDFVHQLALSNQYITERQRMKNVKVQGQWQNPKYDTRVRPKTWAQLRSEGLA